MWYGQPAKSQSGQSGNNNCGGGSSQSSKCQTAWFNDVDDFCLWAPPNPGQTIGATERIEVAWCTKAGRGTRTIPNGSLKGVHFKKTPHYVQVTGVGNFTSINIKKGDSGGELDPHGADGLGNPIGGLVFGNGFGPQLQYHEWTSFISDKEFCFRACVGPDASKYCAHRYDVLGCYWNMPSSYSSNVFESCQGDDGLPMGIYGSSTFHQGEASTPAPHPAPASSNCRRVSTVSVGSTTVPPRPGGGSTTTTTTTTTTSSTSSTTTSGPSPTHAVKPKVNANKCLQAASNTDGAKVTINDCNSSAGQQFTRSGSLFKVFGNKCLDVIEGTNANGTKLQVWSCSPNTPYTNQVWDTTDLGQIKWRKGANKCLDLTKGSVENGNPMQIWTCAGSGNNQLWTIV